MNEESVASFDQKESLSVSWLDSGFEAVMSLLSMGFVILTVQPLACFSHQSICDTLQQERCEWKQVGKKVHKFLCVVICWW